MPWTTFVSLLALVTLWLPSSAAQTRRDPLPESFTATAQFVGTSGSAETTFKMRVERYTPDAEREAALQALTQGGYVGFVTALRKAPVVGSVAIGGHTFDIRWARESPSENGRSIVLVTDTPMFFIGAGSPTAKPRKDLDVGLNQLPAGRLGNGLWWKNGGRRPREDGRHRNRDRRLRGKADSAPHGEAGRRVARHCIRFQRATESGRPASSLVAQRQDISIHDPVAGPLHRERAALDERRLPSERVGERPVL